MIKYEAQISKLEFYIFALNVDVARLEPRKFIYE